MIVAGDDDITGLRQHEVVTLQSAGQVTGHDGTLHTQLSFTRPLDHSYRRDTVTIYANVVAATHGESREEVLGSGVGAATLQRFALARWPLTYVADEVAPGGARSTLELYVDDVRWRETGRLVSSGPTDRAYALQADDEQRTSVRFGDGAHGARLPSGVENLRARYRVGLGAAGNVGPGQISLLVSRPFGVKAVTNPLASSGGAEPERPERIRRNAPLAVTALDRLVSRLDYEDFARGFAGIGKARAVELPQASGSMIHLTVAGADDVPLAPGAPLLDRLRAALLRYGDPHLPVEVVPYMRQVLLLRALVSIHPEWRWERVERTMRDRLLERFGFERRELGQDLAPSEVYAALQDLAGVRYIDLEILDAVDLQQTSPATLDNKLQDLRRQHSGQRPTRILPASDGPLEADPPRPARLILVAPTVPEAIVLERLP